MKNWKTTLAGIFLGAVSVFNTLVTNHQAITMGNILPAVGAVVMGLSAKDHDVTGGTKVQ